MFESKYIMYKTVVCAHKSETLDNPTLMVQQGTKGQFSLHWLTKEKLNGEVRLVRGHLKHRSLIPLGIAQHLCKLQAFMFFHLNLPQKLMVWIPTLYEPTGNSTLTQLDKNSHFSVSTGPLWLRNKVHLSHIKNLQGVSTWPSFPLPAL